MKSKKGFAGLTVIVILVLAILFLVIMFPAFSSYKSNLIKYTNVKTVSNWVTTLSELQDSTLHLEKYQRPPLTILYDKPITINTEQELKTNANKQIATGMIDCWDAFNQGESDFLSNLGEEVFCYPCAAIVFDDSLKNKNLKLNNLNYFLNNEQVPGTKQTYLSYLSNINPNFIDYIDEDYELPISENYFIFFFASRDTYKDKVIQYTITATTVGATIGIILPGVGNLVGAAAGGSAGFIGGSIYSLFFKDVNYNPMVLLGTEKDISKFCSLPGAELTSESLSTSTFEAILYG